jgi:hypothetical protein
LWWKILAVRLGDIATGGKLSITQLVFYEKIIGWMAFWEPDPEELVSLWLMGIEIWGGGVL